MWSLHTAILFVACMGAGLRGDLTLEGPLEVRVEQLGPVDGPVAVVEGVPDAKVLLSAEPQTVAHVVDGELHAVGPGKAVVRAQYDEQIVEWTLVVKPAQMLAIVEPPASVPVGGQVVFRASTGEGDYVWASSDTGVATVDGTGRVAGVMPGLVYITVTHGRAQAMAELRVVTPSE